jgi:hypothetical protein
MKSEGAKSSGCAKVKLESVNGGLMKNVFKMLGALAVAGSLMGCIVTFGGTPNAATQTNQTGVDTKTVKIFYKVTDSGGAQYTVSLNNVTAESLDSATVVSNDLNNPRAVVVVPGNTLTKCASLVSGEGCFQIVTNSIGATSISGQISFKFSGTPLTLNYSANFLKPVPASVTTPGTEGVDDTSFKLRYTAKDSNGQTYKVNKVSVSEEIVVNPTQSGAGVISPRAISIISVVTCDPLTTNLNDGCFLISITPRTTGTKTFTGSVSFKLDGTALSLPFSHTFNTVAP